MDAACTYSTVTTQASKLLVFCNKNDVPDAKNTDRVKLILQKELESMRKTRTTMGAEGLEDDPDSETVLLGQVAHLANSQAPLR